MFCIFKYNYTFYGNIDYWLLSALLFKVYLIMLRCLIICFLLFNTTIFCLKIKIEALKLIKSSTRRTEVTSLIGHLRSYGPHHLLAELLNLETIDFKTAANSKCTYMTLSEIVDIIQEYDEGSLTFDQYKAILSADCASKWSHNVLNELAQLKLYDRLPSNFLESREFNANRMHSDIFIEILSRAFTSKNREMIIWNQWTSTISFKDAKHFYCNRLWESKSKSLWQTINFRNFDNIQDKDIIERMLLARFIGLKGENLESFSLKELISRFYTLLSFIKLWDIDYSKVVLPSISDGGYMKIRNIKNSVREIIELIARIQTRIQELDGITHMRLEGLLIFTLNANEDKEPDEGKVNEFLINFVRDSENIEIGDWLLGIFCILNDVLDLISYENMKKFLSLFFSLRPSIDSIIFTFKLLREKWRLRDKIDHLFYKFLKDKPNHVIEFYKSNGHLIPKKLVRLIPLSLRCIRNLKNRYGTHDILEFNLLVDPNVNSIDKLMEMIEVIGWNNITIYTFVFYKIFEFDDNEYDQISIENIIKYYFELFLEQSEFYEILNYDKSSRPIIRILPLFPPELWHQLAHLLTRAILFNLEIPFTIDFEFFREMSGEQEKSLFLIEMAENLELEADDKLKEFYRFLNDNIELTATNLEQKLKEFTLKLKMYRGYKSSRSSDTSNTSFNTDIASFSNSGHTITLLTHGFKSFIKGLRNGFNLDDFSIEQVYQLIFHRKCNT